MINSIKKVKINFSDKNLFTIWFYLIILHQSRVINKREVAEADRANRTDKAKGADRLNKSRIVKNKVNRLRTAIRDPVMEDLDIAVEYLILKDLKIAPENFGIVTEDLVLEKRSIMPEDLDMVSKYSVIEDSGIKLGDLKEKDLIIVENSNIRIKNTNIALQDLTAGADSGKLDRTKVNRPNIALEHLIAEDLAKADDPDIIWKNKYQKTYLWQKTQLQEFNYGD